MKEKRFPFEEVFGAAPFVSMVNSSMGIHMLDASGRVWRQVQLALPEDDDMAPVWLEVKGRRFTPREGA